MVSDGAIRKIRLNIQTILAKTRAGAVPTQHGEQATWSIETIHDDDVKIEIFARVTRL